MQKIIFFLLAFISLSVQARANWNPYSMNHERFVHLSEVDKQAVIISTMELMVELESKYNKEVTTSGFSAERLKKYVQILQKFEDLILGSAIAADPGVALTSLAGQFSNLLKTLGKNGCIYGGYVSKMGGKDPNKFCRHPSTMNPKVPEEAAIKKAYLTRSNSCIGPAKISCNPVIFGYQNLESTVPICVETSNVTAGKGHNVSYECMKKALAEPNKDARLAVVTKAMSENKEAFNKVQSFIFRTCACKEESSINKDYAAYIKPHRTCFGMINTLRALNTEECGQLTKIVPDTEFAQVWTKYFGSPSVFPKLEPEKSATYDKVFGNLMNQKAVQAICDGPATEPVIETPKDPVVTVEPEPENKTWFCETKCSKQDAVAPALPKVKCSVQNAGFLKEKEERTPANAEDLKGLLKSQEIIIDDATVTSVSIELSDGTKQECPVAIEEAVTAPTCSITLVDDEKDPKKSKATVTFTGLKEKEEAVANWTGATPTAELPNEVTVTKVKGAQTDLTVVFTIKDAKVVEGAPELSCKAQVLPLSEDEDPATPVYTIQATAETAAATSVKVNAKITIDGKEAEVPAGFKISWSRKGTGVAKLTKPVETKPKTNAGVQDTPPEGEEVTVETGPVVIAGEVGTGTTITETRVAEPYETGASLINDKGASVAGPSFANIPKLDVPKVNPYQNFHNQQQPVAQPPPFMFQGQNTATQGF